MRYFLDTKFSSPPLLLLSIGVTCEDGRNYYSQFAHPGILSCDEWAEEYFIPTLSRCPQEETLKNSLSLHLEGKCEAPCCPWRTAEELQEDLLAFFDQEKYGTPEIWGWCAGYDFLFFCQLLGGVLPEGYPHFFQDIQQLLDEQEQVFPDIDPHSSQTHHALLDAQFLARTYQFLKREPL